MVCVAKVCSRCGSSDIRTELRLTLIPNRRIAGLKEPYRVCNRCGEAWPIDGVEAWYYFRKKRRPVVPVDAEITCEPNVDADFDRLRGGERVSW